MIKDAQKAMAPWMGGQHIYAPMSQHSSQKNPLLYAGSFSLFLSLASTHSRILKHTLADTHTQKNN